MMFGWVIGIVLVVVIMAALGNGNLIKGKNQKSPEIDNGGTAIETLKNRYTEGRIDKSEFEEKKTELEKKVLLGMK